mgnify:CR=1 FL=1
MKLLKDHEETDLDLSEHVGVYQQISERQHIFVLVVSCVVQLQVQHTRPLTVGGVLSLCDHVQQDADVEVCVFGKFVQTGVGQHVWFVSVVEHPSELHRESGDVVYVMWGVSEARDS